MSKESMTTGEKKAASDVPDEPRGGASTWYEVLDIAPQATAAEIQQGYDRALALVEGRTIGGYFLLDPMAVASARADIDAAWFVLGDASRRAAYDAKIGNAQTLIPTSAQETLPEQPAVSASEPDDITASDARRMLGLPSTPSGEGVFAPLSPEAKAKAAANEAEKPPEKTETTETTETAATTSTPPQVTTPAKRTPSVKFLKPVVEQAHAKEPPAKETSSPGRKVGGITFAPPQTDAELPAPTPKTSPTPPPPPTTTTKEPELSPTATVLPTATMPAPTTTTTTTTTAPTLPPNVLTSEPRVHKTDLPVAVTPMPMPGLFNLEGTEVNGQLLKRLREARGLSLEAMVEATKIRKPYLMAIEEQDVENLPARVYLRGFLTQIARVLRVDKVKLAEGYLAFVARYGK